MTVQELIEAREMVWAGYDLLVNPTPEQDAALEEALAEIEDAMVLAVNSR